MCLESCLNFISYKLEALEAMLGRITATIELAELWHFVAIGPDRDE